MACNSLDRRYRTRAWAQDQILLLLCSHVPSHYNCADHHHHHYHIGDTAWIQHWPSQLRFSTPFCSLPSFYSCLLHFFYGLLQHYPTIYLTGSRPTLLDCECPVHRLREDCLLLTCARDGHLEVWRYQMLYNTILTSWWWAHGARNM